MSSTSESAPKLVCATCGGTVVCKVTYINGKPNEYHYYCGTCRHSYPKAESIREAMDIVERMNAKYPQKAKDEIEELSHKNAMLASEASKAKSELASYKSRYIGVRQRLRNLEDAKSDNEKIVVLQQEIDELEKENADLKNAIPKVEPAEVDTALAEENESLHREVERLEKELDDKVSSKDDKIKELENIVGKRDGEIFCLGIEVSKLKSELETAQTETKPATDCNIDKVFEIISILYGEAVIDTDKVRKLYDMMCK